MPVINDFAVNGLNPSTVGGTGTAVKYFPRLLGSSIGVESVAPSATSSNGQLVVNGFSELNAQWFKVSIGGDVLSGVADSSVTVEVALYANTAALNVAPSYTKLATTGALTAPLAGTNFAFGLDVDLLGDTASGVVRGFQRGIFGANNLASASLTNNLSGINMGAQAPFGLVVGVTFGSSDAANAGSLRQFQISAQ